MKLYRYALLILSLTFIFSLTGASATHSAPAFPDVELVWAWGYARTPGWAELQVTFHNEDADWVGELRLLDTENNLTYTYPLELPARSYKHYRIPLFMQRYYGWKVELRARNGNVQSLNLPPLSYAQRERLCVMADPLGNTAPGIAHACHHSLLVTQLAALPETALAWETVDVFLLNGLPTAELTAAQKEALLGWVGGGGQLVIGGGPTLAQALDNLPEPLRVAQAGELHILDSLPWSEQVAVARLTPAPQSRVLWQSTGLPIAVGADVGAGSVYVLGWDLTLPGNFDWTQQLWETAPIPAVPPPSRDSNDKDIRILQLPQQDTLLQIPASAIPALWQWILLFPLYVLLMGPGTLFIVRRLKRPVLAWALIPLWIVVAVLLLSLVLSGNFSRTLPLIHQVAVVRVTGADLPARYIQGTAIYAPRSRVLRWQSPGAPRPFLGQYLFDSWYTEGDPFAATINSRDAAGYTIALRNPLGVITWGDAGLYHAPALQTDLTIVPHASALTLEGTLWSAAPIQHAYILFNHGLQELYIAADIPANQHYPFSVPLTDAYTARYNHICDRIPSQASYYYQPLPPQEQEVLRGSQACYAVVQIEGVPAPIQGIGGTHLGKSCLIHAIPCPGKTPGVTQLSLPLPLLHVENGWMDMDASELYLSPPETTVYFVQPIADLSFTELAALNISLTLPTWSSSGLVTDELESLAVWNWVTETWLLYSGPTLNAPLRITESVGEYVDAQKGVRLRLTPNTYSTPIYQIAVSLSGQW